MGMRGFFQVAAFAVLATGLSAARAATTYNVGADWSYVSNPNGVWSYNAGATPLPFVQFEWGGVAGETFWATTPSGTVPPAWAKAATTRSANWLPGDVIVHATNAGDVGSVGLANLTWTSPGAGTIDLSGKAWDAEHLLGRDDAWSLWLNGDVIAARGSIFGVQRGDASADFANNLQPLHSLTGLSVQSGDVVKFEVTNVAGGNGHFTGLDLTVSYVPEPAATTLAAAVMLGMFIRPAKRQ